jgi:hypothetical protein
MQPLVFAVLAYPGQTDAEALLLIRSLRTWGGAFSSSPVRVVYPHSAPGFSPPIADELNRLNAQLLPVKIDPAAPRFPFAFKVRAAGIVEEAARGQVDLLALLDPDTLIVGNLQPLRLPVGKHVGYRPVHHTLIGSVYSQPLDAYWQLVYRSCDVPSERVSPMNTCTRDHVIRPYFNAGSLVVRPEAGILRRWSETFFRLYQTADFLDFYAQDRRYAIFTHQTILSGVILAALPPDSLCQLPPTVNYPLHLHDDLPVEEQVDALDDLVTCRYEELSILDTWRQAHPGGDPLAGWLDAQLAELRVPRK